MKSYRVFIDVDKEEKWLNGQALQGHLLRRKTVWRYEFEQIDTQHSAYGKAVIRVDYRTFSNAEDFEDYRALFEDSGWTHLSGTKSSGYQYFITYSADPSMDIFSDIDSRAGRYKRLAEMWLTVALGFLPLCFILFKNGYVDIFAFLEPKSLYYTPGLWEKSGLSFWRSFLIETPFALMRGFFWHLIALALIASYYFYMKTRRQYSKTKSQ